MRVLNQMDGRNPDAVVPEKVPQRLLSDGARMPAIGLGTFGSDHESHQAVADAQVAEEGSHRRATRTRRTPVGVAIQWTSTPSTAR